MVQAPVAWPSFDVARLDTGGTCVGTDGCLCKCKGAA